MSWIVLPVVVVLFVLLYWVRRPGVGGTIGHLIRESDHAAWRYAVQGKEEELAELRRQEPRRYAARPLLALLAALALAGAAGCGPPAGGAERCESLGGVPRWAEGTFGWEYAGCDFPPPPCPPAAAWQRGPERGELPAEAGP